MTTLRRLVEAALARLAQVGADAQDDEETRLRKALLVLISALDMLDANAGYLTGRRRRST